MPRSSLDRCAGGSACPWSVSRHEASTFKFNSNEPECQKGFCSDSWRFQGTPWCENWRLSYCVDLLVNWTLYKYNFKNNVSVVVVMIFLEKSVSFYFFKVTATDNNKNDQCKTHWYDETGIFTEPVIILWKSPTFETLALNSKLKNQSFISNLWTLIKKKTWPWERHVPPSPSHTWVVLRQSWLLLCVVWPWLFS